MRDEVGHVVVALCVHTSRPTRAIADHKHVRAAFIDFSRAASIARQLQYHLTEVFGE